MQLPTHVTFRGIPPSEALEANILEKAAKLDALYDHIMSCRVVVETPHGHHHQGNLFHVSIDITVPDAEIVVNRSPKDHQAHENAYVAVRDAFDAARRKLQDYVRKQRGKVKTHENFEADKIPEILELEEYDRITGVEER